MSATVAARSASCTRTGCGSAGLDAKKLPVAGKTLGELFPSAEQAGVLEIMREVCMSGQPKHLKSFEFRELGHVARGKRGETSRWDWEIYPLSGPTGDVTHLLN